MAHMVQEDGTSSSVTSSPLQLFSMMSPNLGLGSPYPWLADLKPEERGLCLIHLILTCGNHVSTGGFESANMALDQISHLASPNGDTIQRIASYFAEALANRILKNWPGLYKALNSTNIADASSTEEQLKLFYDLLPFMKVGYVVTNQAILEAMEGEKMIHVIDLNSSEPAQWIHLLQALSVRVEGPPHLRITGIHKQKEVLDQLGRRLIEEAERLDIPFQFNPVVTSKLEDLDFEKLRVKTGEALAISSVLQLHPLLATDEDDDGVNLINDSSSPLSCTTKMDSFLNALWGLFPKIMVVTEQDSNHNGSTLMERLVESLYYYAALFDCLESGVSRKSLERLKVEKMLFGEEIKNIISCEKTERIERHEKLEKWIRMLRSTGFGHLPLSYYNMLQGSRLLQGYGCAGYNIKDEKGCLVICWQERPLYSISAWRSRR